MNGGDNSSEHHTPLAGPGRGARGARGVPRRSPGRHRDATGTGSVSAQTAPTAAMSGASALTSSAGGRGAMAARPEGGSAARVGGRPAVFEQGEGLVGGSVRLGVPQG